MRVTRASQKQSMGRLLKMGSTMLRKLKKKRSNMGGRRGRKKKKRLCSRSRAAVIPRALSYG